MGSPLHQAIAAKAGNDPAILVSDNLLVDMLTRRLRDALLKFLGFFQPYATDTATVQIGLTACTYDHAGAGWKILIPPGTADAGMFVFESQNRFEVTFAVTMEGDPSVALFEVELDVSRVSAVGSASYNSIAISDIDVDLVSSVIEDPNIKKNAVTIGISEADIHRLEGLVQGAIAPKVLRSIFAGARALDVRSLFPTINFQGQSEVAAIAGGLLVIGRNGWDVDETKRCPCAAAPPEINIRPRPAVPRPDGTGGSMPVDVAIPPPRQPPWPVETNVRADVALYMPQAVVAKLTSGPYPAITDATDDNGFIGWSFEYTVAFTGAAVSLADPRATLVLRLEFYVSGSGKVNVDLGCFGRQTAGLLWATNRRNGASVVEVGITPRLQPDGKIVLVPELLSVSVKDFEVDVIVIALSLLSYFGPWGTLAAFVLNEIIRRVIAHNLPIKMRSALEDAMGKQMWTLVDLTKVDITALFKDFLRLREAVSRESDSLLVGLHADLG